MQLIAFISISAGVYIFFLVILIFNNTAEQNIKKRITNLAEDTKINVESIHEDVLKEKRKKAGKLAGRSIISKKFTDNLTMSGIKLSAMEYLCAWLGVTLIPALLMFALGRNFVTVLGVGIIGFILPPALVQRAKKKRQQLFSKQLGDSLTLMSNCMKTGYSFQQAMESIASDMQPPISIEFAKVLREVRYGVKLGDALTHMEERLQDKDLAMLVSAVIVSSQVGANLSDILDTISEIIKDRIKIRNDVRILSSQGRLSGLIIGLLPVIIILLLMLINPVYILSFLNTLIGKILIVISIVLEIIGFTIINKIVNIEY